MCTQHMKNPSICLCDTITSIVKFFLRYSCDLCFVHSSGFKFAFVFHIFGHSKFITIDTIIIVTHYHDNQLFYEKLRALFVL